MNRHATEAGRGLLTALEDHDSVMKLTRKLVRIPSRAGIDPYGPVLKCMSTWLAGHGLAPRRLSAPGGETVAMVCEITGSQPGPRYVLDACLDTAPFGDEAAWTTRQYPARSTMAGCMAAGPPIPRLARRSSRTSPPASC